ncbi:hypothetical protein AAG906_035402 [Vitis piasezkii]
MDTQQSRHVVLEDTPSDLVTPPVLPVRMPLQILYDRLSPFHPLSHELPLALGLDEAQLLTLFPLSLSGMTQRWYASLETSRRRTWEDLAQEFLRQYSFDGDLALRESLSFLDRDRMSLFLLLSLVGGRRLRR